MNKNLDQKQEGVKNKLSQKLAGEVTSLFP